MSGTETRVKDSDRESDEGALDDRAERVVSHARELERIREEKRDRIEENRPEASDATGVPFLSTDDVVLTGWIRDARRDADEYVLAVDVEDDGELVREEFRLDWPADVEEADIDNGVIALTHFVGDGDALDDILEQQIPIVKIDGEYRIDFPTTPRKRHRASQRIRRRLTDTGVLEYDEQSLQVNRSLLHAVGALAALPIAFSGATTLYEVVQLFGGEGLSSTLIGALLTTVIAVVVLFVFVFVSLMFDNPGSSSEKGPMTVLALEVGAVCGYSLFNTVPSSAPESFASIFSLVANSTAGFVLFVAGGLLFAKGTAPAVSFGWQKLRTARDWLRKRRGIDYLRNP